MSCPVCGQRFYYTDVLQDHISSHNHCFTCSRSFVNARALNQHVRSDVHKPRAFNCPLCNKLFFFLTSVSFPFHWKGFKALSSAAAHVESGQCPQGRTLNRRSLAEAIRSWEVAALGRSTFTTPMIENGSAGRNGGSGAYTTADCVKYYSRHTGYFVCPLCDRCFDQANNLSQHLNGKAHANKDYKCPTCARGFISLNGLCKHWEATPCGTQNSKSLRSLFNGVRQLTY
ncbi:hypothetical protein HK101_008555 [Irineochytrium annulatum]|nr:hypothetical protein HK101_008555 [Irineochytrium annulatum]